MVPQGACIAQGWCAAFSSSRAGSPPFPPAMQQPCRALPFSRSTSMRSGWAHSAVPDCPPPPPSGPHLRAHSPPLYPHFPPPWGVVVLHTSGRPAARCRPHNAAFLRASFPPVWCPVVALSPHWPPRSAKVAGLLPSAPSSFGMIRSPTALPRHRPDFAHLGQMRCWHAMQGTSPAPSQECRGGARKVIPAPSMQA